MNKRHYEHTLPNIRGSLSNTYKEPPMKAGSLCQLLFYNIRQNKYRNRPQKTVAASCYPV